MQYLTSEEIKNQKDYIKNELKKPHEFLNDGILEYVISNYVDKSDKILEIGCGSGETLKFIYDRNYRNLYCADIDDYLQYNEFRSNFSLVDLNKDKIPLEDNSMGVIIAINVLEHLENPFHFARESLRLLKTNGILLLSFSNGNTIFDKLNFLLFGSLYAFRPNNNHISFLLDSVFEKAFKNFICEEIKYGRVRVPYLRPKRLSRLFPKNKLFSYNKFYILRKNL